MRRVPSRPVKVMSEKLGIHTVTRTRQARKLCALALVIPVMVGIATQACSPEPEKDPAVNCRSSNLLWSESEPPINLRHIFCGELDGDRAGGLHADDLATTSPVVAGVIDRREKTNGIYTAIVQFADGQRKRSTFFPDACDWREIQASITHATTHPVRSHRRWGQVGLSAPANGARGYCLDNRGRPFEIRFALRRDGRVNTAFPN